MAVARNRKCGQDVQNPVPQPLRQRELPMPHLPKDWEACETVRRRILWDGRLLAWPKAELIGVASYKAASLNGEVLTIFFNAWVAECDAPKSPGEDEEDESEFELADLPDGEGELDENMPIPGGEESGDAEEELEPENRSEHDEEEREELKPVPSFEIFAPVEVHSSDDE
ncbi:unnamed protein product, partial [Symbiodinium sp. CCMP2456]